MLFFALVLACTGCSDQSRQGVTIVAVGDVMMGRYIGKVMGVRGNAYPFVQVQHILKEADVVVGNLEAVFADETTAPLFPEKPYNLSAPPGAVKALKDAGFSIVMLANNHAMDFGPRALMNSRTLLEREGIAVIGAGRNITAARTPAIMTIRGVRIAFFGYGVAHSPLVYASKDTPGTAPIIQEDIKRDIQAIRGQVNFVVVSYHWGKEYDHQPSPSQRQLAYQTIDWGADLVLGHHPHVMQGIETYKGKTIAYSLGNFLFDQKGNDTDRSFMLVCKVRRNAPPAIEILPLDRFETFFPRIAEGTIKAGILHELKTMSATLNR